MGKYADWYGYREAYPQGVSEAEFEGAIARAEALIDVWTAGRAEEAEDWAEEQLKMAVYALVSAIVHNEDAQGGGVQLESVSNDGYSERYFRVEEKKLTGLKEEAMKWLSGTGLVSAL